MTNVSAPYLLQLTVQRLRVTSCQDYTDVFRSFIFISFFILSRGSIRATSQTARYRRASADLFSSRLLLLGDLTGAQISGIDFARASAQKKKKKRL